MNLTFHCFTFKDEPFDAFADFTKMVKIGLHAKAKEDKNAEDRSKFKALFKGIAKAIAIVIVIVITIFIYMYV